MELLMDKYICIKEISSVAQGSCAQTVTVDKKNLQFYRYTTNLNRPLLMTARNTA